MLAVTTVMGPVGPLTCTQTQHMLSCAIGRGSFGGRLREKDGISLRACAFQYACAVLLVCVLGQRVGESRGRCMCMHVWADETHFHRGQVAQ